MEYNNPSDSSGTDDDLPPNHTNRVTRGGRPSGNGRAAAGSSYGRPQMPSTADQQIRKLEVDAYTAVLRAFGAQSENITWAKERLMSDLRKELRVPDEQHRDILTRIFGDESIRQIREWRQLEEAQPPAAPVPVHDPSPSPAVSQSRKKQKTAHVTQTPPILPPQPPPPLLKPVPNIAPPAPSPAASKRGVPVGPRGKKAKGGRQPPVVAATTPKTPAGPPAGRGSNIGRGPAPTRAAVGPDSPSDHHIGRKVQTRWPEDNTFYEAVITDFDPAKGLHALVYDMGTAQETWEWVNLKEMSSSDMKWVEAAPISLVNKGIQGPPPVGRGGGRGMKRGGGARGASAAAAGRARGAARGQAAASTPAVVPIAQTRSWRGSAPNENGLDKKGSRTLQIPVVEPLLKEQAENLKDITDIEKLEAMKRKAKAHGEALRTALAELGESSEDAGSDDGGHAPHTRLVDRERVNRSRDRRDDSDDEEDTAGDGRGEESDGEQMVGEGGGASDGEQLLADEGDEEDEDG
ncbi:unnamed protein product [Calypogeia fissa]